MNIDVVSYLSLKEGLVMDDIVNLFNLTETVGTDKDEKILEIVLREFLSATEIDFSLDDYPVLDAIEILKLYKIPEYADVFYTILQKYNYRMKHEIKDAIWYLSSLSDHNKNSTCIKRLLQSPVIQDISFNGHDQFSIYSDQYGEIQYRLASKVLAGHRTISNYIKENVLINDCHNHTFFLSEFLKNGQSITSLCRYYFDGSYYHSYTYDPIADTVIDLCFDSIMLKRTYDAILEPQELSVIENKEVRSKVRIVDEKICPSVNFAELLRVALYQQYLNSIGYKGTLAEAPKLIKRP